MKLQEFWAVVWDRVLLVDFGDWEEGRREGGRLGRSVRQRGSEGRREGASGLRLLVLSGDLPVGTQGRATSVTLGCVFIWAQGSGGRL